MAYMAVDNSMQSNSSQLSSDTRRAFERLIRIECIKSRDPEVVIRHTLVHIVNYPSHRLCTKEQRAKIRSYDDEMGLKTTIYFSM